MDHKDNRLAFTTNHMPRSILSVARNSLTIDPIGYVVTDAEFKHDERSVAIELQHEHFHAIIVSVDSSGSSESTVEFHRRFQH
jgi:hypothetical protein